MWFLMIRLFFSIFLVMLTVNICHAAVTIFPPTDYGTFTITPEIDFGTVTPGSDVQPEVTVSNTGDSALIVGDIASSNTVADPFTVIGGCANTIIQPGEQCSFMVLFSPESAGLYPDSFNIEIISDSTSHEVFLTGQGGAAQDEADIQVSFSSVDFGTVDVLESTDSPYTFPPAGSIIPVIFIKNIAVLALDISSLSVTGPDLSEVSFQGDCAVVIPPGGSCGILIEFKPVTPGIKNAAISITSNDPDESVFNIGIRGTALGEDDGVPAVIEDAGPNNGDGNNDDILDSKQSNVVTLVDSFGSYVTYLTENTFRFKNMSVLQQTEVPADFVIGSGIFDFAVEGLGAGQSIEAGIILPAGMKPGAYYMYGPTADNPDKHWFDFSYDGETGAIIIGDVTFTTSSGAKFTRSVLKVIFKDGGRGDTDLTINGTIAATSAMPISQDTGGSGSVSLLQLISLAFILILARNYARVRSFSSIDIKH